MRMNLSKFEQLHDGGYDLLLLIIIINDLWTLLLRNVMELEAFSLCYFY